jgi:hypothetical protein
MWDENISNNLFKMYRGIVEDNNSPIKDGRVRVRIFGIHSEDKSLVPTNTLPWAELIQPLTFGYGSGIGITSVPRTGSWVFVILENDNPNNPIIVGGVSGKSTDKSNYQLPKQERIGFWDVNDLANPGYPNNHVIETLAGHIIEIDDAGGTERIRICHTNGNEVLLNNEGISISSVKDRTELTAGKFTQTVLNTIEINSTGSISINTAGSVNISSNGVTNLLANGDVNLRTDAELHVSSTSHSTINVGGNATVDVTGNMASTVHGTTAITSVGACSLTAQAGLTADVTGTTNVTSSGAMKLKSSSTAQLEGTQITLKSSSNTMVI